MIRPKDSFDPIHLNRIRDSRFKSNQNRIIIRDQDFFLTIRSIHGYAEFTLGGGYTLFFKKVHAIFLLRKSEVYL